MPTLTSWATYNSNNQLVTTNFLAGGGVGYDAAGDVTYDGYHQYLYDGDGRVCAVRIGGSGMMTGYLYDADGARIAKGTISQWSCDPSVNGFAVTTDYVLGLGGEQVTEMQGGVWQHTNVYAAGKLMATYDGQGLHFYLDDPLGTRRAQTNYAGVLEQTCSSLPFGDELSCTGSTTSPTEHHFTGKERDAESGLDYFGARYLGSSMGRWMSPDQSNLGVDIYLPQTWNRYNYAINNPLSVADRNGLWPFYVHENIIDEAFPGLSKEDLDNLKTASWIMDYAPGQQTPANSFMHGMSDGSGTVFYGGGNEQHAWDQAETYIDEQTKQAQQYQANWIAQGHTGFSPLALNAFGNALHTVTDRTSPAHEGEQPWADKPWWHPSTINHFLREAWRSDAQKAASVQAAKNLWYQTFEPCAYTSTNDVGNPNGQGSIERSGCQ